MFERRGLVQAERQGSDQQVRVLKMGAFRAELLKDFAGLAALASGCYPGDGLQYTLLIFNCAFTIAIIINVPPMSKL